MSTDSDSRSEGNDITEKYKNWTSDQWGAYWAKQAVKDFHWSLTRLWPFAVGLSALVSSVLFSLPSVLVDPGLFHSAFVLVSIPYFIWGAWRLRMVWETYSIMSDLNRKIGP